MSLTPSQQYALDQVRTGRNVFISGSGGVGKSYLANHIIENLEMKGKKVLVTASTGKAALLIGGVTCHRAFRIPLKLTWLAKPRISSNSPIYAADAVLIDEVSMLRIDAFEYIVQSIESANRLRKFDKGRKRRNPVQLIVIGDFFQLPPVLVRSSDKKPDEGDLMSEHYGFDVGAGYAFLAPGWQRCNFKICELKEVIRQSDQEMIRALNLIRTGDKTAFSYFCKNTRKRKFSKNENVVHLCGKNKTAEQINNTALARLPGQEHIYNANITGQVSEQDKQAPEVIRLKAGAHVIMLQNADKYQNGSSGIVTKLRESSVSVLINDIKEEIEVPYVTWAVEKYIVKTDKTIEKQQIGSYSQLPLRLGYAITIHKAQGQTFDKVTLYPEIFVYGQLYVALSRIRDIKNLYIDGDLDMIDCLAAPEVINFYNKTTSVQSLSAESAEDIDSDPEQAPLQIPVADPEAPEAEQTEQTTEVKTEDLIAIHCPRQCIRTVLTFINQLILIDTDKIMANPDLETIFLPQAAATYQDAICNFIRAIS